jgi:hypothetical protein
MARYLHRCSDGKPYGYIDEDIGDPMLYTLEGQWAGYISDDGVYGPDGALLFSISDGYFYDASGAATPRSPVELRVTTIASALSGGTLLMAADSNNDERRRERR